MSFKFKVGDKVTSVCGNMKGVLLLVDHRHNRCKVLFDNGRERNYSKAAIESGDIDDKPYQKIKAGDKFNTNKYGTVIVNEYISTYKIIVEFKDGVTSSTTASSLRLGNVGHPMSGLHIGFAFTNSDGCVGKVIRFNSPYDVEVEWFDGVVTKGHGASHVKLGGVYYPNHKSVCGVGYFGIGDYISDNCGKTGNYNKRVYGSWCRMLGRCYDPKEQMKPKGRSYIGVTVCDEWHCFQNFAKWASDKEGKFIVGFELDKDMFGDGLSYSPENCTLLPASINTYLAESGSPKVSGLPEGVNVIKPKKGTNATEGFVARCHVDNVRQYLGFYKTPEEAAEVYKVAKESEAVRLAAKFKSVLSPKEYNKLMNFTLSAIHRKKDT